MKHSTRESLKEAAAAVVCCAIVAGVSLLFFLEITNAP